MLRRDPHAERSGPDREPQGRLEHQGFAVDAGGYGAIGADFERCRRPLSES